MKSVKTYESYFKHFEDWYNKKGAGSPGSEDVLLLYFDELVQQYKVSTCWTRSSAIKSLLYCNGLLEKPELPNSVMSLLKAKGKAYNPKKSLAFSKAEMER